MLDLKICDMACGSGAFLVQACRYLAERLVEAWDETSRRVQPGDQADLFTERSRPAREVIRISPYGEASKGSLFEELVPLDPGEQLILAQRLVAQRCLYGVDKNKLAVEMAKLSLWLLTMARDRPFSFLDHAIRWGDSLLGVDLEQLRTFSLARKKVVSLPNMLDMIPKILDANKLARSALTKIPDNTPDNVAEKARRLKNVEYQAQRLSYAADLLLAVSWKKASPSERDVLLRASLREVEDRIRDEDPAVLAAEGRRRRSAAGVPRPFHWPLEFPEVFLRKDRAGFDAFVCNPPFMDGQKITGNLGTDYRDYLVEHLAGGKRGSADLCAYFALRAASLLRDGGQFGFLATNTIAQGDTREVGLDQLTSDGCVIPRAVPSRPWPGAANLEVAHVWLRRGRWKEPFVLDEKPVTGITAFLTEPGTVVGPPKRLAANDGKSFQGSIVLGMGFVMEPEEAQQHIGKDSRNRDVLFPYLNGEDINSRPDQSPSRWVINFFDWPLDRDTAPDGYAGPVAADYPDCLAIVEEKVKPERAKNNRKVYRERWWQYAEKRPELQTTIAKMERYLVHPLTSKYNSLGYYGREIVASHMTVVLALETWGEYALIQNDLHWTCVLEYGNKLENRPQYTPSDCFETFPFPPDVSVLDAIGQAYYDHRCQTMLSRQEGLTKTYNLFHDPEKGDADIQKLRDLHVDLDRAVATAYGWTDLDLGHDFHHTRQGLRFTLSEPARREVLARLLALNHQRHAEEVKQGLHAKKGGTKKPAARRRKPSSTDASLFGADDA